LVYLGNKRSGSSANISIMEAHEKLLSAHFKVYSASNKRNKIVRMLDMIWTLFHRGRKAEVVIIAVYSTLNFYYALIIALFCRAFRKPFISYLHGGNLPSRLQHSPKMSRAIFAHSYANVAPSGYLKVAFENAGFKSQRIPNFIEVADYPFKERSHLLPNFLWVRAFEKTYQPETTIKVFASVHKLFPNARLCMVGPDKDGCLETCKALANQLKLSEQISFPGGLPKDQWIKLAADYDLFISTPLIDNTPVSVIEAMALGMPVISTNVGGVPYIIDHGKDGMLSPDGDNPAMVQNITRLLNSSDLSRSICLNARIKAESFDWKIVEKQWLNLINGIS